MMFRYSRLLNLYLHLRSLAGVMPAGRVFKLSNFLPESLLEEVYNTLGVFETSILYNIFERIFTHKFEWKYE